MMIVVDTDLLFLHDICIYKTVEIEENIELRINRRTLNACTKRSSTLVRLWKCRFTTKSVAVERN